MATQQSKSTRARRNVRQALWDGLRLVCPACREGRIYESFFRKNHRCPHCRVIFERGSEGDFLVTTVAAYSIAAVLISLIVFILNFVFHDIPLVTQLYIIGAVGLVFTILFYRNVKGLAIGGLHLVFGLYEDLRSR